MNKKRSLTGIKPSGTVHLGNYLGMIRPALDLQKDFECFYFIADFHALTTTKSGEGLESDTFDLVATWIACGFDIKNHILFRQSDIPVVTELAWYLSCFTGLGLLEKCHAYKDARDDGREVNHGLFAYPVLMAADILLYDIDVVPVGKDQKQHLEVTRDIAGSVNAVFKENLLKLPDALIREEVMTVPGIDGRKMSKSYGNVIPLFSTEKELKKLVLSITSDSTPLEDPKTLKGNLIGEYVDLFCTAAHRDDLEARLQKGGLGWGHAKIELFEAMNKELTPLRERFLELRQRVDYLKEVLDDGARKASAIAIPQLQKMRDKFHFARR
jgi:tryptophanyl-tRNA synthetase